MERTSTESDRLRIGQAQLPTLRLRVSLRESLSWFRIYFIFTARALHRKCIVSIVVDYVHVVKEKFQVLAGVVAEAKKNDQDGEHFRQALLQAGLPD